MMINTKSFFYLIFIPSTFGWPQINLERTDWTYDIEKYNNLQHDCLLVASTTEFVFNARQVIAYCLTESSPKWNIRPNTVNQNVTFAELYHQGVIWKQLYLWSAPLDTIERYQIYLSQREISMDNDVFYNCTSPRFGPQCQYSFDIPGLNYSSVFELVHKFYIKPYDPETITCYIDIECDLGSAARCLDWTDVCDGVVDCLNDQIDEKHCWQMSVNECQEQEFRCGDGQCIPMEFSKDNEYIFDCLDKSDLGKLTNQMGFFPYTSIPSFYTEDIKCSRDSPQKETDPTSSCVHKRRELLMKLMVLESPNSITSDCWSLLRCHLKIFSTFDSMCKGINYNNKSIELINKTCPDLLFIDTVLSLFGHVHFVYEKEFILNSTDNIKPHYICYDNRLCDGFYSNRTILSFNDRTCRRPEDFPLQFDHDISMTSYRRLLSEQLYHCNTIFYHDLSICNHPMMYKCKNSSKCISHRQLCDNKNDCDYKDDEQCLIVNGICSVADSPMLFKCMSINRCVPMNRVANNIYRGGTGMPSIQCDVGSIDISNFGERINFAGLCDGEVHIGPIVIDNKNETDETECTHWSCHNYYTECDGVWNCANGADEAHCYGKFSYECPLYHHICISPVTYNLTCLPFEKANDGIIDCLGATDEPAVCRRGLQELTTRYFHCKNDSSPKCITEGWCLKSKRCMHKDEEPLCDKARISDNSVCDCQRESSSAINTFFCSRFCPKASKRTFKLSESMRFPKELAVQQSKDSIYEHPFGTVSFLQTIHGYNQRCHRGIPLRIWLDHKNNLSKEGCLCPPSYYGEICQYQNQRVSLTVRFRAFSDSRRTLFIILFSLIDIDDNERHIESYEQHTYLYSKHCSIKYNVYLLYPTRPKNPRKNYSIHIDVYEKISLSYRGSFFLPIPFSFLPVNRIAVQMNILPKHQITKNCFIDSCLHGQCVEYMNEKTIQSFCRCEQGWYGKFCNISRVCQCSSNSICAGVSRSNQSICICPMNRWGNRCLLENNVCQPSDQSDICLNGGQCIADDEKLMIDDQIICICRKGYDGKRCENRVNQLILSFHKKIDLPQAMIVHFIFIPTNMNEIFTNGSTVQAIFPYQSTTSVYWPNKYHISFVQLRNNYYLILVQHQYNTTAIVHRQIHPSDRCKHLSEVLDKHIVQLYLVRRMKYYQIPCQKYAPHLQCFYDQDYFCFCYSSAYQRLANCFPFKSIIQHDCYGYSICENNARCIQDSSMCPKSTICVCPDCYHGTRCQFSSHLFGLSLDGIIGFHIQPFVSFTSQTSVVKISLCLTIIIILLGVANSILSWITFQDEESRKNGCGYYLLASSFVILLTMLVFGVKVIILLVSQMTYISNELFLKIQCHTLDFFIRLGLTMDQYLNACVAVERLFTVIKGVNFDQKKSKRVAKYTVVFLLIGIATTNLHDPIHRRLIHDNNEDDVEMEKRIWCVVNYSSAVRTYSLIINLIHFSAPFMLNLISALLIIKMTAMQRTTVRTTESYRDLLLTQFRELKHLLIAPIVLIILALPRFILSFISNCMKSTNDVWLPLMGYFISFIPPMFTLVLFIVPSEHYRKQFTKSVKTLRTTVASKILLKQN
ncbi:unnamed protein product [Adineta ricciae]|uniref:Uncharacterized protein n=1 Tax=Adineta ricciae TaxID=249248 RepID=A0A814LZC1_ADIRI|nr:unnamed protein product [Adineta ricciae]CAF1190393.1 unnamed protein product [Adineta ricciae]